MRSDMEEFLIVTKKISGINYEFPLHYFPFLDLAEGKRDELHQKNINPGAKFYITHMVLHGDEFVVCKIMKWSIALFVTTLLK